MSGVQGHTKCPQCKYSKAISNWEKADGRSTIDCFRCGYRKETFPIVNRIKSKRIQDRMEKLAAQGKYKDALLTLAKVKFEILDPDIDGLRDYQIKDEVKHRIKILDSGSHPGVEPADVERVQRKLQRLVSQAKYREALLFSNEFIERVLGRDLDTLGEERIKEEAEGELRFGISLFKTTKNGDRIYRTYERKGYGSYRISRDGGGAERVGSLPADSAERKKAINGLLKLRKEGYKVRITEVLKDGTIKKI